MGTVCQIQSGHYLKCLLSAVPMRPMSKFQVVWILGPHGFLEPLAYPHMSAGSPPEMMQASADDGCAEIVNFALQAP